MTLSNDHVIKIAKTFQSILMYFTFAMLPLYVA